jgi:endonuclease/exonuclease/phosphatase family metal-dependent hydrolase
MTTIKILWYNIKRGFHKKEEDGSSTFEPRRLEVAKKVVSELNPDILVLGEADFNPKCLGYGKVEKVMDYQKIFDYPFVFNNAVTERKGETILSKYSFEAESFAIELFSHIKAKINLENKQFSINIVHPYPRIPENEKAERIVPVLRKMKAPCILLGDFNALSPEDKYSIEELTEGFKPARGERAIENAKDAAQCLMIKEVIMKGLVDAFRVKNKDRGDTIPTKGYTPFKNNFGDMRLDYIFCSKDIKIIDCKVIKNNETDIASDHYPVFAELEI